jgi:IQ domain-containing protein H
MRQQQSDAFKIKKAELRQRWPKLSTNRRVIVHIPSLGLSESIRRKLNNLPVRENYQIGRLFELEDPNVNVIYVSPMSVNDEILQYYNKLVGITMNTSCCYYCFFLLT